MNRAKSKQLILRALKLCETSFNFKVYLLLSVTHDGGLVSPFTLRTLSLFFFCGMRASHCCGLSCCGAQALDAQVQRPWLMGLATPQHVGSSRTGARTSFSLCTCSYLCPEPSCLPLISSLLPPLPRFKCYLLRATFTDSTRVPN